MSELKYCLMNWLLKNECMKAHNRFSNKKLLVSTDTFSKNIFLDEYGYIS